MWLLEIYFEAVLWGILHVTDKTCMSLIFISDYEDSYFIYVIYLVGKAVTLYWMNEIGSNTDDLLNFGVYTQRMPYPPYTEDPMIIVIQKQLPLFIVLSLILSVVMSTKHLVYEKEKQVKVTFME